MKELFLWLLNNSISATWLLLVILVMRLFLSRKSRTVSCFLWLLLAAHLIIPFRIESPLCILPESVPIEQEVFYPVPETTVQSTPQKGASAAAADLTVLQNLRLEPQASTEVPFDLLGAFSVLWLIGFAGMSAYTVRESIAVKRKLSASIAVEPKIYSCDYIEEPFVFGMLHPKIYLPSDLKPEELPYVLAHEQAHLRRRDHLWKPLGFFLLSLYWFHPMIWFAYIIFCRDIEVACDETVIQNMTVSQKIAYSRVLLHYSGPKNLTASPLAFGEKNVKHRITNIVRYKRPTIRFTVLNIFAITAIGVGFLTAPVHAVPAQIPRLLVIGQYTSALKDGTELKNAGSIVLTSIDEKAKEWNFYVLPSWTYLEFGYYTDPKTTHVVGQTTLNIAHALGKAWNKEKQGSPFLTKGIAESFDISIDGSAEAGPDVFMGIVDALGGIDLPLENSEIDCLSEKHIPLGQQADGKYHLNGNAAYAYRYLVIPEESLYCRSERNARIIATVLDACQKLSREQFSQLLDAVLPLLETDIEKQKLEEYRKQWLDVFSSYRITVAQCPDRASSKEQEIDLLGRPHKVLIPDLNHCSAILRGKRSAGLIIK